MSHLEQFKKFTQQINDFDYVIIRGYHDLPNPEGDLDIVFRPEDYNYILDVAKMLKARQVKDFGFAEWCDMKYCPHFTSSKTDTSKRIRLDLYNSIYFLSPMNDYTTNWTISEEYFDAIMHNKILNDFYYIPSSQDEIVLTIMRAVLDRRGWKEKYKTLCDKLLNNTTQDNMMSALNLSGLPYPEHIYKCLVDKKYEEIVTWE